MHRSTASAPGRSPRRLKYDPTAQGRAYVPDAAAEVAGPVRIGAQNIAVVWWDQVCRSRLFNVCTLMRDWPSWRETMRHGMLGTT